MSNPCFLRSLGELLNLTNVHKVTFYSAESIPHKNAACQLLLIYPQQFSSP